MAEQRSSHRVEAQHFISYDVLNEQGQVVMSGMALSRDLSRKGVRMENREPFPEQAEVKLHLAVEDEVIDVMGQVRHIEKAQEDLYYIGIEFEEIDEAVVQKLASKYPEILHP